MREGHWVDWAGQGRMSPIWLEEETQPRLRTALGPQLAAPGFTPVPAPPTAWAQKHTKGPSHHLAAALPVLPAWENPGSFSFQPMAMGQKTGCLQAGRKDLRTQLMDIGHGPSALLRSRPVEEARPPREGLSQASPRRSSEPLPSPVL